MLQRVDQPSVGTSKNDKRPKVSTQNQTHIIHYFGILKKDFPVGTVSQQYILHRSCKGCIQTVQRVIKGVTN